MCYTEGMAGLLIGILAKAGGACVSGRVVLRASLALALLFPPFLMNTHVAAQTPVSAAASPASAAEESQSSAEHSVSVGDESPESTANDSAANGERDPEAAEDATLDESAIVAAERPSPHWVDSSHAYASNQAQSLAQWMDDFFGAPIADAERANSFLRTILIDDWDQRDGHDPKVRLRGQINLPKISERVDLFFSGEEAEATLTEEERSAENDVGLRVNFRDGKRTRLDATVSLRSGPAFLPGVRFRYQQPINDVTWGRFTQRLQYHTEDGFRSLSNFEFNRILDERSLIRWGARVRYREDREFWDWNTGITLRHWFDDHRDFPSAVEYYVAMSGRDQPQTFDTNYRIGVLYRRQFFRDYLFYEIEPNYNWRRDTFEEDREGVLAIVLRLEVMLGEDPSRQ